MSRPQDLQEGDVYIGRGNHGGIPKSFWQNMYVIDRTPGGMTREQVIEAFRETFRRSPEMQARIGELSGRVLRCHCEPHEACHADVLIEAWQE